MDWTPSSRLVAYLKNMDAEVEGWFAVGDGLAFSECLKIQEKEGIAGDIAEIGVHHGKSFLALAIAARRSEILYAIDIFGRQDLNIDRSGLGNFDVFKSNCEKFAPHPEQVKALEMSSLELKGKEKEFLTPLRFLSIDGGHTRDITLNDIEIAERILVPGGMCCIDDIIHMQWTGVLSGVFAYFYKRRFFKGPSLVPFAMLPKKLYMCRPQFRDLRRLQFAEAFGAFVVKKDAEFGPYVIDIYKPGLQEA